MVDPAGESLAPTGGRDREELRPGRALWRGPGFTLISAAPDPLSVSYRGIGGKPGGMSACRVNGGGALDQIPIWFGDDHVIRARTQRFFDGAAIIRFEQGAGYGH